MAGLRFDPQIPQGGQSALGAFAMQLTERAQKLDLMRQQAQIQTEADISKAKALGPYEVEQAGKIAGAKAQAEAQHDPWKRMLSGMVNGEQSGQLNAQDLFLKGVGPSGPEYGSRSGLETQASIDAEKQGQMELQKRVAQGAPARAALRQRLPSMAKMLDTIPPPKAGPGRIGEGIQNFFKGNVTQEMPAIQRYEANKKLIAGYVIQALGGEGSSRLSDQDAQRALNAFSNASFDTQEARNISWAEVMDALNALPEIGGTELLRPKDLFKKAGDFAQARELAGQLKPGWRRAGFDESGQVVVEYADGTTMQVP